MLSDVLKRKDLYDYFSRSAFEKAHAYQAQGRVKGLEVSGDLTHLRARVRVVDRTNIASIFSSSSAAISSPTSTANAAVR